MSPPRRWRAPVLLLVGVVLAHLAGLAALAEWTVRIVPARGLAPAGWTLVGGGEHPLPGPLPLAGEGVDPHPGPLPLAGEGVRAPDSAPSPAGRERAGVRVGPAPAISPPAAFQAPPAFHIDYRVQGQRRGRPIEGEASLSWQPVADGHYLARLHTRLATAPPRTQESAGRLAATGFSPTRFSDHGRSEHATHFDGDRFVFSRSGPRAGLRSGAQDPLSVLLQLAGLAAADPSVLATGREVVVQVAGTQEVQDWRFASEGLQALQLPSGEVDTIRLMRAAQQPFDWTVEAWLAPSRDYAPVRLRLTRADGDWLDHFWPGTDKR